ncbi:MAG: synthase, delta subunit, partial [Pseudomonadota bacterium]
RSANALGPWLQSLDLLASLAADPDLQAVVSNPKLQAADVARFILDVAGDKLTAEQCNFVTVLVDNHRFTVLPEIHALFTELKDKFEAVSEAHIESAFPLDEATLGKLVADLEQKFGNKVRVQVSVSPELIGGVRIAVGDQVIDASVRGKLAAMATALKN